MMQLTLEDYGKCLIWTWKEQRYLLLMERSVKIGREEKGAEDVRVDCLSYGRDIRLRPRNSTWAPQMFIKIYKTEEKKTKTPHCLSVCGCIAVCCFNWL